GEALGLEFLSGLLREANEFVGLAGRAVLILVRYLDAEPALEQRMNHLAMEFADVRAVGRLGGHSLQQTFAVGDTKVVAGSVVLAPDFLVALPHGVALLVPRELVGMNEVVWSGAGDNHPVDEIVSSAKP